MKGKRCLTNQEADAITTILDEEEMKLRAKLDFTAVDDRCRSVWPNWESHPSISPPRLNKRALQRDIEALYSRSDDRDSPRRRQANSPAWRPAAPRSDAETLKTDMDTLYSRITGAAKYNIPIQTDDIDLYLARSRVTAWPPTFESGSPHWSPQPRYVPTREEILAIDRAQLDDLRRENLQLKADLLWIQKRIELEAEEQDKLQKSLEMSKRVRDAHKKLCKIN